VVTVASEGLAEGHAQPVGQLHGLAELDLAAVLSGHLFEQFRLGVPVELGKRPEKLLEAGGGDQLEHDQWHVAGVPVGVPLTAWLENEVEKRLLVSEPPMTKRFSQPPRRERSPSLAPMMRGPCVVCVMPSTLGSAVADAHSRKLVCLLGTNAPTLAA
jgi:hypothetical protein